MVKRIYGELVTTGSQAGLPVRRDLVTGIYLPAQLASVPASALDTAFPCGNPVLWAELQPGDVVLDLGCGAGMDVILASRQVGRTGWVYGLDLSEEMVDLAQRNVERAGLNHVRLVAADMESIPLEANTVDVVLSNCGLSLVPEREKVLREIYRVLRPGGRLVAADTVLAGELPPEFRQDAGAWAWGVAGAGTREEYLGLLADAGFKETGIQVFRSYEYDLGTVKGTFHSARITGTKP